jgi:DNA primase
MQKKKAAYKAAKVNDCIPIISQDIESIKALLLERLEKAVDRGRYIKSLCPFHGENIPSFVVYLDTLTYHCFACGAHGTVQ